jgi:ABC-type proline/glycine betaine transport system substrate-binding protein
MSSSTLIAHAALLRGDVDVSMETWIANIATYKDDIKAGAILELGINFDDNRQGIYVPRYVIEGDAARGVQPMAPELRTVADLKKYPAIFQDEEHPGKGRIYGAIPGWAADEITFKKFKHYKLDERFVYFRPGSEPTLYAAFVAAQERGLAIAGYLWEPTWLTGKYDLVLLADAPYSGEADFLAGRTAFPSTPVAVVANKKFVAREPAFAAFLQKYKTSTAYTAEALAYMEENKASHAATAKYMLKKYPAMLSGWLPADKAGIVLEYVRQ